MNKKQILITVLAFLVSCLILIISSNPNTVSAKILGFSENRNNPRQLYRVYLAGKSIGVIESKKELEDYIDNKQQLLKEKYNVSKVYAPNDLDIVKEITYNEKVSTIEETYNKIEKIMGESSFTIDGYKIKINGIEKVTEEGTVKTDDIVLYVLDKEVFTNSVNKTITAFVDSDSYNSYLNGTQKQLEENETGSLIEKLYIENTVTITKERIPAGATIYQTTEDLSKFLLFGTTYIYMPI